MNWVEEVFGTKKPIIGMCHLEGLPGDPAYDPEKGMQWVVEKAGDDVHALQDGGVDAIMFSNERSMPYMTKVEAITTICMARIIGELCKELSLPYGVDVLWDPRASIDLAVATGASFVREVFTGVYASDFGLWNTNCGEVVRHQAAIGGKNIRLLYNIVPESAAYLGERNISDIARSTMFNNRPDALCVSGLMAGDQTDVSVLRKVKDAVPDTIVFANTGLRIENVEDQLRIADGGVVGTTFKFDGVFENHVDATRVKRFMEKVRSIRQNPGL